MPALPIDTCLPHLLTQASSLDKQLRVVSKSATKMLISCGGGIIETPAGRGVLAQAREQGAHILWLRRPIEQIEKYLMADASRPSVGDIQEVCYWSEHHTLIELICS